MNEPLFSIITVCYNSEKTIGDTLKSIVKQTFQDFEYIIIDGKSTDNTLKIIDEYKDRLGDRLTIVSEKDNGIYDAINKGVRLAKGKLIGMVFSDDWYEADALRCIADNYKGDKLTLFYGMQREYENGMEKICWLKNHQFLESQMLTFMTCFLTRDIYEKYGMYDVKYKSSADYDYFLKLFRSGEVKFRPIYSVLANFRLGGMSGTNIGAIETAEIRYKNGIISRSRRNRIVYNQKCRIFVKKLLKAIGIN